MIGIGLIAIKKGDSYELHRVSPWELAQADKTSDIGKAKLKRHAKKMKWKPDHVVTAEELKSIQAAKTVIPGRPNYHAWAADIIVVL